MPEVAGYNLCGDCHKQLVSLFFPRFKTIIGRWFSFGQKSN
jgi:hypothetical protein